MQKSKILKMLTVFIIIIMVLAAIGGILFADSTINGKRFKTDGGTYHNAFQDKDSDLFKIKWDDVKNKYYTAGSWNDYQDYIVDSKDGYCLNELESDGSSNFYVAAIIDINGGMVQVRSRSSDGEEFYVGKEAAEMAKATWYRINKGNDYTFSSSSSNQYFVQYWMNWWGWAKFYPKVKDEIGDRSVAPTYGINNNLKDIISENGKDLKYYNLTTLKIQSVGTTEVETGSYKVNGVSGYKTKIGKFKITKNNGLTYKIKVVGESGTEYNGVFSDGYIYTKTKITEGIKKAKISQSYNSYKARFIILGTGASQARLIAYTIEDTIEREAEDDTNPKTNVSLQKYIVKVNNKNITTEQTALTTRANTMTKSDETDNRVKKEISSSINANASLFKYNSYVNIKQGDTVTYNVTVYNNSAVEAKAVAISDKLTYYTDDDGEKQPYGKFVSVSAGNKNVEYEKVNNYTIKWVVNNLGANASKTFTVTVKYDKLSTGRLVNTAWITGSDPSNQADYRTVDRDYVKMPGETNVSLQKYIVQVNNTNLTDVQTGLKNRQNTMTYVNEGADGVKQKISKNITADASKFKYNDPVTIERGDLVTYKISVYNNSNIKADLISVRDSLSYYNDSNGNKLPYGTFESIMVGNKVLTKLTDTSKATDGTNYKYIDNYAIEWKVKDLQPGAQVDCYVKVRYNDSFNNIKGNNAWIATTVPPNDTNCRTADRDYVVMEKDYSVKLEKYITAVNNNGTINPSQNRAGHPIYNQNDYSKENNPVMVEKGDKVTYTIKLTNTGERNIKHLVVTDKPSNLKFISCSGVTDNKNGTFTYTGTIEPGENKAKTFTLTYEVTGEIGTTIPNTAEVSTTIQNQNSKNVTDADGKTNNKDTDWVKTKTYAVSLEKYVTAVNNNESIKPEDNRAGHPIYNQNGYSKEKNPVMVEAGDKVTYTIVLRNLGDASVNNLVITDKPNNLKFISCSGVIDNKNGTFTYTGTVEPGEDKAKSFTLTYEVTGGIGTSIPNTATLSKTFKNKNNITVTESDVSDNVDTDWVRTKIYAVSLEKYITEVNSSTITSIDSALVERQGKPHRGATINNKKNNPVLVNKEDTITYKIRITNTGDNDTEYGILDKVVITDTRLLGDSQTDYLEFVSIANARQYSGGNVATTGIKDNITYTATSNSEGTITYDAGRSTADNVGPINVGAWVEFDIIFKVKNTIPQGSLVENKAEISSIANQNNITVADSKEATDKDNKDSDWVKIRITSVAIQKFVTEVKSLDGTSPVSYTNRVNHRYNEDVNVPTTDTENKDPFKKNNYVKVEKGDIVTFTIRLLNTGELPVTITKIYDSYTYYSTNDEKLKDTGLIFDSISGSGNPKILNDSYGDQGKTYNRYLIGFNNPVTINPKSDTDSGFIDIQIKFKVDSTVSGKVDLRNKVGISEIKDTYGNIWSWDGVTKSADGKTYKYMDYIKEGDYDGPNNNYDMDFLEVQEYKVSLQKIVYKVGNNNVVNSLPGNKSRWNSWESHANTCTCGTNKCVDSNNDGKCDKCLNDAWYNTINKDASEANKMVNYAHSNGREENTYAKHNNPVTVANNDLVTYAIRVKNDGDTKVKITKIIDKLPSKVTLDSVADSSHTKLVVGKDYNCNNNVLTINPVHKTRGGLLPVGESGIDTYYVTVRVTEANISLEVLRNEAYIEEIKNKNDVEVLDKTPEDNQDADYIQMRDIVISGVVWNDIALNKEQNKYDGLIDSDERKLAGVTVRLYREGIDNPIAETITTENGTYSFDKEMINPTVITEQCERYIKGPYKCKDNSFDATSNHTANYWTGRYYSYYIVFEYDGVTYTSTTIYDNQNSLGILNKVYEDSNAKEDNGNGKSDLTSRDEFNNRFETINNQSGIDYKTVNGAETIPESIHNEKDAQGKLLDKYKMQSSTNKINLSNNQDLETQLQHVNLGLRGRDIFDLELITDVYQIKVTVNGEENTYKYANKVNLRKTDLNPDEDMANIISEKAHKYVDSYNQNIRETDLDVAKTRSNYKQAQGVSKIEVTYKITVQNTSITDGTATKIIDYYDDAYTFVKAYAGDKELTTTRGKETSNYKSVVITTPKTNLTQSEPNKDCMDIYVVYKLNPTQENPIKYSNILNAGPKGLPTSNMAEIVEYTTKINNLVGQTKYTVGLIDKDSAPGSAETEDVRLDPDRVGDVTTVEYYFAAQSLEDLLDLEYEDDTYAAPIIYYVKDTSDSTNQRKISGVVFEDKTEIDPTTKIKTGNGKQELGRNEVGVYGVTVQLIEKTNEGEQIRFTEITGKDGEFEFKGFLPGKYIIRYWYGNSERTVLMNKAEKDDGTKVNQKSYNGEDFQATNNSYKYTFADKGNYKTTYKLDRTENYWYVFNEKDGISSGFDNKARRQKVSTNVSDFTDEQMTLLNNIRDGIPNPEIIGNGDILNLKTDLIDKTYMYADTQSMKFTIEKTIDVNELEDKDTLLSKINIIENNKEKGILLGQWAVYPSPASSYYKEYRIDNMNFGIAEVPVTKFDLQKHVSGFTIKDSTGNNVIARISKVEQPDGTFTWDKEGDVITDLNGRIDVSIEDEKLQGSRLEIRYTISVTIDAEVNYDRSACVVPEITGVADFVNNNLSYNENLVIKDAPVGADPILNSKYWTVTTYTDIKDKFKEQIKWDLHTEPVGTIDPDGTKYTTILKATDDNPLLKATEGTTSVDIVLEKILSSTNSTIEEIITSTVDIYEYDNIVEIIGFEYESKIDSSNQNPEPGPGPSNPDVEPANPDYPDSDPEAPGPGVGDSNPGNNGSDSGSTDQDKPMRDRVRTPDRHIIIPGVQHDYAISEAVGIHPPTGTTQIDIMYYIVAIIALGVLAIGAFGIRKIVIKK